MLVVWADSDHVCSGLMQDRGLTSVWPHAAACSMEPCREKGSFSTYLSS
jgi:hypothetical protein